MDPYQSDDGFDFEEETEACSRLTDGININELISNSSATFEVSTSSEAALEESYGSYFGEEDVLDYVNLDCVDAGSDDESIGQGAPENTPFERIATKMKNVTEDGKVKKRIIKPGNGPLVEKDSIVMINYNAYVEYSEEPYDSSYLRGRPVRQKMNEGNFIAGLEIGISTMKKGEVAQFLIHPDYGYGKLGCPPRIPPEAELLIQVELLRITDPCSLETTIVQSEDSEKPTFAQIIKRAESLHVMGNDLYKKNSVSAAISKYRKASSILNNMTLANEEEQQKQQKLLCKLHVNSAICYNKINNYRMACVACRLALDIQPRNAKALFNYGRALIALGDYNQAKSFLKRAQREERNNKEVNQELEKLEKKMRAYQNDMSTLSKRMFSLELSNKNDKPEDKGNYSISSFANDVKKCLDSFINQNAQTLPLPNGMTHEEEAAIKTEAEKRGLQWKMSFTKGQRQISVVKCPPSGD